MSANILTVREIEAKDIDALSSYWADSPSEFLVSMGVDLDKIPDREQLKSGLSEQLNQPYNEKKSYCIMWEVDGNAIGHSNVNKIIYGKEAYMHLHLWNNKYRKQGYGSTFVKKTLPYFFKNLKLETLFCEPYSLNPAPNKTLERLGFKFVREYVTVPNWINFEQQVNLWEMSSDEFEKANLES